MKIRSGFVSNSSSSSFCVYGSYIAESVFEAVYDDANKIKILEQFDIDEHGNPDCYEDTTMVGRRFTSIKDDETGGEFKKKTSEAMKKLFGEDTECSTCKEGWYDG